MFFGLFFFLIFELSVIHYFTNGWLGFWGDFDEIEVLFFCDRERFFDRKDSSHDAFAVDDANFGCCNSRICFELRDLEFWFSVAVAVDSHCVG